MNAVGELHLRRSDDLPYRWEPVEDVRTPLPQDNLSHSNIWLADGGWLGAVGVTGVLQSVDVSGTTRWSLPAVGWGTGFQDRVLDDQGVYYVASGEQLTAVQTDVLPAPNTMCLDYYGCNAQGDRYLRPE